MPQLGLLQIAGHNRVQPIAVLACTRGIVEPQLRLAMRRVRTMAGKAILRENGTDVLVESHLFIRQRCNRQKRENKDEPVRNHDDGETKGTVMYERRSRRFSTGEVNT